jgi:hypothetical protein
VQDQQVDPVDAELAGALVKAVQRLVVTVVTDPDLRLDEHLVAGQARVIDGLADFAFVVVRGDGVDEPVAERGHLDAVVQGHVHGHGAMRTLRDWRPAMAR